MERDLIRLTRGVHIGKGWSGEPPLQGPRGSGSPGKSRMLSLSREGDRRGNPNPIETYRGWAWPSTDSGNMLPAPAHVDVSAISFDVNIRAVCEKRCCTMPVSCCKMDCRNSSNWSPGCGTAPYLACYVCGKGLKRGIETTRIAIRTQSANKFQVNVCSDGVNGDSGDHKRVPPRVSG